MIIMLAGRIADLALGWVVSGLLSKGLAALKDGRDRAEIRDALQRILEPAVAAMIAKAPNLAEDLASDSFIEGDLRPILEACLNPTRRIDPDALLQAFEDRFVDQWRGDETDDPWHRIFGTDRDQALKAMRAFVIALNSGFDEEPNLRRIGLDRRTVETNEGVRRIEDAVGDLQISVDRIATAPITALSDEDLRIASADLLNWEQTTDGSWIDRAEQERLRSAVLEGNQNRVVLLGEPGAGKSALLARLASHLAAEGRAVLAIKADRLPKTVSTTEDLGIYVLGRPGALVETLRLTAAARPLTVIIDQLDAVSDTVDTNTARMHAVIGLIAALERDERIRIVVSVRPFEFGSDARFRTALPANATTAVTLELPAWDEVAPIVARHHDIDTLSAPTREILRNPQALVDAVALMGRGDFDDSLHSLFDIQDRRLNRIVSDYPNHRIAPAMNALVERVFELGDLSVEVPPAHNDAARLLIGAGLLLEEGARVRFRHQTWTDTVVYRQILDSDIELGVFVRERQAYLPDRPRIASVLRAMAGRDPARFDRELRALWDADDIRMHVKYLLVGQVRPEPGRGAIHVARRAILGPSRALRQRAFMAIGEHPSWWTSVQAEVQALMRKPSETAWQATWYLGKQIRHHSEVILGLLRSRWLPRADMHFRILHVLAELDVFDETALVLFNDVVQVSEAPEEALFWGTRGQWEKGHHETAARMLAAVLARITVIAEAQAEAARQEFEARPVPRDVSSDENVLVNAVLLENERNKCRLNSRLIDLLRQGSADELPEHVVAAPAAYAGVLFPWLASLPDPEGYGDDLSRSMPHILDEGELDDDATPGFGERLDPFDVRTVEAAHLALVELARADPDGFLALVESYRHRDRILVRKLVMRGFAAVAEARPTETLEYLLEGGGRFATGVWDRPLEEPAFLINRLSPHLTPDQISELEAAISAWSRRDPLDWDKEASRRDALDYNEQDRITLLAKISPDVRSEPATQRIEEEFQRNPRARYLKSNYVRRAQWVKPRMSANDMAQAKGADILEHLKMHSDREQSGHIFGEFAKAHPDRALALIKQLDPAENRFAVAAALREIARLETTDLAQLLEMLDGLLAQGLDHEHIRHDLAHILEQAANDLPGLEDRWIDRLVDWIDLEPHESEQEESGEPERAPQVLFQYGGGLVTMFSLNQTILEAIGLGLARRPDGDVTRWLEVMERNIEIPNNRAAWYSLYRLYPFLRRPEIDPGQADAFLRRLMLDREDLRQSTIGIRIFNWCTDIVSDETFAKILDQLAQDTWSKAEIAAGEIAFMRTLLMPEDAATTARVRSALEAPSDSGFRVGLANAAVMIWTDDKGEAEFRDRAFDVLATMIPQATEAVAVAVARVIGSHFELPVDVELEQIIGLVATNDAVIAELDGYGLTRNLTSVLVQNRATAETLALIEGLVRVGGPDLADMRKRSGMLGRELPPLIVSLHREQNADIRTRTLELFEQMLEISGHDAERILGDLDVRP
jgi:hypothetical protein